MSDTMMLATVEIVLAITINAVMLMGGLYLASERIAKSIEIGGREP